MVMRVERMGVGALRTEEEFEREQAKEGNKHVPVVMR